MEIVGYTELLNFTTPEEKYIIKKNGEGEEYFNLRKDPLKAEISQAKRVKRKNTKHF